MVGSRRAGLHGIRPRRCKGSASSTQGMKKLHDDPHLGQPDSLDGPRQQLFIFGSPKQMALMPATRVESGQLGPARSDGLMKAIVQHKYGEPEAVLELQDVAKPVVRDGEVLVRIHAASVHVGDWILVRG